MQVLSASNYFYSKMFNFAGIADTARTSNASATQSTGSFAESEYLTHLESKYGTVTIRDVGKDQLSLEQIGKGMSGRDVVISPKIFAEMADNPEKATYYEGQIDSVFNKIPEYTAQFAAQGLTFQSCGIVIHEDGTITHVSGSSDSPERVAKVEEENRAKKEKRMQMLDEIYKRSQENTEEQRRIMERIWNYQQHSKETET